jgi:hypothetical protein
MFIVMEVSSEEGGVKRIPWKVCPRDQFVYIITIIIIATVITVCLYNLTTGKDKSEAWIGILSFAIGSLLPNPKIRRIKQDVNSPSQ